MLKKRLVVLSGAGMSAESGLKTFRDADGLWEGHDVMEVASVQGWRRNRGRVLDFYNQRRRQLREVEPNSAHRALADLEHDFQVQIITQNVDDLHERAGSSEVLHLHGELLKVRSTFDEGLIMDWKHDLNLGDFCEFNHQLRPHIVWFGEEVPLLPLAAQQVSEADIVLIVGTSLQVYPAASLMDYASAKAKLYYIDPKPAISSSARLQVIAEPATVGVPIVVDQLRDTAS
ncbi:SIR2 family NAD-dependent protein deacylase [Croceiramulus getboli]|nr:NAD-dependent deacylase [Flavobacteriaceae bacterium YJPT1-3]